MQWYASLQPPLVGAVLLWAASLKLFGRSAPQAARRSALARLVGKERAPAAYRTVAAVELAVAALLLLPPVHPAEAVAALALCTGMLAYLGYARLRAPDSSCGCMGERHTPVRPRSFARAGLLLIASGLALAAVDWWPVTLLERPFATVGVLLVEVALVVALSPELDRQWLHPVRRARLRLRHPLANRPFEVPLAASVQQLQRSDAYRSVAGLLRSDVLDTWDEGDWRILTYSARHESGAATAVFAVPLRDDDPDLVRVVLVGAEAEEALA
jgi:hypothetical protein